jgi:hypothetical protein
MALIAGHWHAPAHAQSHPSAPMPWAEVHWPAQDDWCSGHCALYGFWGRNTSTSMTSIFGLDNAGRFAPQRFVAPWNWRWHDASIAGGAASRRLVSFLGGVTDLEGEVGVGQRFGAMSETEVWAALFLRWTWFPWHAYLRTTIAISSGLNYASGVPELERMRDSNRRGSRLLHYFSPEMTFALPQDPQWELVARLHHRSGMRILFGDVALFNGVDGGAHFMTLGLRWRF